MSIFRGSFADGNKRRFPSPAQGKKAENPHPAGCHRMRGKDNQREKTACHTKPIYAVKPTKCTVTLYSDSSPVTMEPRQSASVPSIQTYTLITTPS